MPGRRSGEGALCRPDRNGGRSLLWIVWTAWTAPCCSLALWAVCFPVLRNRSPPMHAPERWPYGEIESWWAWRDHLDRVQDPHIATLKREADCEIARILRCCEFEVGAEAAGAGAGGDREPGLMDEAGQPLGRASPDDESGLEPRFSVPSAVGGTPLRQRRQPFVHRERSSIPMGRRCVLPRYSAPPSRTTSGRGLSALQAGGGGGAGRAHTCPALLLRPEPQDARS